MRLLLDTHVFLWALTDDARLPGDVRRVVEDPTSTVFVSAASIWEATIKIGLGRLDAEPAALAEAIVASGFLELPISSLHAAAVADLEPLHRDPFDRLLLAQASVEHLVLATVDDAVRRYPAIAWLPA